MSNAIDDRSKDLFTIFDLEVIEPSRGVQEAGAGDLLRKLPGFRTRENHVGVSELQTHFDDFLKKMQGVLSNCKMDYQGFSVDTVEINAQVSAKGQIGFMGTGVGMTGTGGIKFVFKRAV